MNTCLKSVLIILAATSFATSSHKVYLVHGFGSAPIFMISIENYLKNKKMQVVNYGYPSLQKDLTICADSLLAAIIKENPDTVSFVTHSMGALVLRSLLSRMEQDTTSPVIKRIVMITPPNHGAEIADFFANNPVWQYILGPNIQNMKTDTSSLANKLPVPKKYEIGIIIGISKNKNGYNPFIKGNNDGYLTPGSARLGTEKEEVFVNAEHSMIIHNKKTLELTYAFLLKGQFEINK